MTATVISSMPRPIAGIIFRRVSSTASAANEAENSLTELNYAFRQLQLSIKKVFISHSLSLFLPLFLTF